MSNSDRLPQAGGALPKAKPRSPKRFSIVWLLPLATILIAGWLGYRAIIETGPTIEVTFETADDLQAGKTKVMYKGVQTGTVKSISISQDLSHAIVEVEMVKRAESHLNEGTQFWVVRPQVGLTGISGLSTLVSGAYIGMAPGSGAPTKDFKGLSEMPLTNEKGTNFSLHAERLGSIHVSAPVLYRGESVGEVVKHALGKDGKGVDIHIVIYPDYVEQVRKSSVFWNSSGIDIDLGNVFDASIEVDSLSSLVAGGIAFATPRGASEAAAAGSDFKLHDHQPKSLDLGEGKELFLVLTAKTPNGVAIGDNVTFRQVPVGQVIDIRLAPDAQGVEIDLRIDGDHAGLVHEKSVFWNASGVDLNFGNLLHPNIKIGSLESLVAGGIAFSTPADAGPPAKYGQRFSLASQAPAEASGAPKAAPSLHIVLKAEVEGAVKMGDPILYREFQVGQVADIALSDDADLVLFHVDIEPRYAALVQANSVFWNASGIHASFGLFSGAQIDVESLSALLRGGIAFATPPKGGGAVASGAAFTLHSEAKKDWQSWAPHIRLPQEAPKDAPPGPAAPESGSDSGPDSGPDSASASGAAPSAAAPAPSPESSAESPSAAPPPMPDAVTLPGGGHIGTSALIEALTDLGFDDIGDVDHAGNVIHATATWQGEAVKLRIDTQNGQITPGD